MRCSSSAVTATRVPVHIRDRFAITAELRLTQIAWRFARITYQPVRPRRLPDESLPVEHQRAAPIVAVPRAQPRSFGKPRAEGGSDRWQPRCVEVRATAAT